MSFESFKSIAQTLTEYQIVIDDAPFITACPFLVPDTLRKDLTFYQSEIAVDDSESGICEMIIFPVLSTVYRHHEHYKKLSLWSHKSITYDDRLTGTPDFMIAKRSPLGKVVLDKPYFVTVEAKRDDFIKGWGQCLAQMVAIQKINGTPDKPVYGIVTNGQAWQFGQLINQTINREMQGYSLHDLDDLMAALNFLFQRCEELIQSPMI